MRDYRGYGIGETVYFVMKPDDEYIQEGKIKGFFAEFPEAFYIISCGKEDVTVLAYLVSDGKHDLYEYIIKQKDICRVKEIFHATRKINKKYDGIINEIRLRKEKDCG